MTPEDKKMWLKQEESRLIKYQHQHRGLSFLKLTLPPSTDRKVNLVGEDNHIYRGSIRRIPEDQFPLEVDEKSIDEEALYKDIRDMNFPPVPENEPLGPCRRIGGSYTLVKRLILAPVQIENDMLEETTILGKDGGFYRGKARQASTEEMDENLEGIKKLDGFTEPTLVTLQTDTKFLPHHTHKKSIIKLPITNAEHITKLIKHENAEKRTKIKETTNEEVNEGMQSDTEKPKQTTEAEENTKEGKIEEAMDAESKQITEDETESEPESSEEKEQIEQLEESDALSDESDVEIEE